jgi:hypothetical protein
MRIGLGLNAPAPSSPVVHRTTTGGVRSRPRLLRFALRAAATVCVLWSFGGPIAARVLYTSPTQQPRGAAKLVFYCHLD